MNCELENHIVKCFHKHPNKNLCLYHDSIFDIWIICGGSKIYNDSSLSQSEKREKFLDDFSKLDFLDENTLFSDEVIAKIESSFDELFKNRG